MLAMARHILVDSEAEASRLKQQLKLGADFATLAKRHSRCPSGKKGGDLGEIKPRMMVRPFDQVVFSKPLHQVQGPIKTQFGWHLILIYFRSGDTANPPPAPTRPATRSRTGGR